MKFLKIVFALVWVVASVLFSQLIIGSLMVFVLGKGIERPVWTAVYSALSYALSFLLIAFVPPLIITKRRGLSKNKDTKILLEKPNRVALGLKGLPTWTDIGLTLAGFIAYLLFAAIVTAIFSAFPWFNVEEAQELEFDTLIFGFDRVVAFITLVVVAPIMEELIFRGWLYDKLRRILNDGLSNAMSMIISILLVSVLFGVLHMQWNVGINVFALSVILCGLREITGTVYAGILVHMLKNGIAFYLLFILGIT